METILISACLVGDKVRYDGKSKYDPLVKKILEKYNLVPFCPEVNGGLKIPRDKVELIKDKAITISNKDVTTYFNGGANKGLNIINYLHIKKVILKDKSPSCGVNFIYDGSFTNKLINGKGIFTSLLIKNNIEVYTITEFYNKFILKNEDQY